MRMINGSYIALLRATEFLFTVRKHSRKILFYKTLKPYIEHVKF